MRIFKNGQLLEASTVDTLDDNIHRAFPDTRARQHTAPQVQIGKIEFTAYPVNSSLKVVAAVTGKTNNYTSSILFDKVTYETIADESTVTITTSAGTLTHFHPIELKASTVKVNCNCLDFRWRFAHYNHEDDSLNGQQPPPYVRRTTTHPPANPSELPGFCRHLIKVVDTLQKRNIVY